MVGFGGHLKRLKVTCPLPLGQVTATLGAQREKEVVWDGIRKVIWKKNFDEMEIIGNKQFRVAVPIEADPEFKAMVFAAGITHSLGNSSIDYTLKRHGEKYLKSFDPDNTCPPGCAKELFLFIRNNAVDIADALSSVELASDSVEGMVVAVNLLIRLQATFSRGSSVVFERFEYRVRSRNSTGT